MKVIGLDHGSRRIGIAVADEETGLAFARPALQRTRLVDDLAAIHRLADEERAETVVMGLPRNMDGSEGPQALAARRFGERLAQMGLAVAFHDERLTSWQAAQQLGPRRGRQRRSGELDSAAARLILQEWMDALPRPSTPQEAE